MLHSTTIFALIDITDKIKRLLDGGNYVLGIYLDLSKAFTLSTIILRYTWSCEQFLPVKNSSLKFNKCGVPQGSVRLRPTIFSYISDIQYINDPDIVRLFADGDGIFRHHKILNESINSTKTHFAEFAKWFVANKLTLNDSKSCFSIFHTKNKFIPDDLQQLCIGNITMKRVKSAKYIGLIINERLNFKDHVENLIKSLLEFFGIFNHLKFFVSVKLARQLYSAFIYSHIKYGIEVYG